MSPIRNFLQIIIKRVSNGLVHHHFRHDRIVRMFRPNVGVLRGFVMFLILLFHMNHLRSTRGSRISNLLYTTNRLPPTLNERFKRGRIFPLPTNDTTIITGRGSLLRRVKRRHFRYMREPPTNNNGRSTLPNRYASNLNGL